MIKYAGAFIQCEESRFAEVNQELRKQMGLVGPRDDPFGRTIDDILVWEDSSGVGRFRVTFMGHPNYGKGLCFRYWEDPTIFPELVQEDPMLKAIHIAYDLIKPEKIPYLNTGREIIEDFAGRP